MAPAGPTVRKRDYAKEDAKRFEGDYYRLPPFVLSIVIVISLVFFWLVCYDTSAIPLDAMGPFGKFVLYLTANHLKMLKLGFRFVLMIHVMEAGFAYRICRRMKFSRGTSFKWLIQTAVVGFPSLGLILRHRKERELAKVKSE
ncbi:transmembrane protein 254-like [Acropora muricata]|uniref:transmembrane protein 254-like n=1 Tax=Acropora muricata TaxID=159855 RepID=UPI0034E49309